MVFNNSFIIAPDTKGEIMKKIKRQHQKMAEQILADVINCIFPTVRLCQNKGLKYYISNFNMIT